MMVAGQIRAGWPKESPFLFLLLYIALAAALLGANPFARQTAGPFDLLAAQGGWRAQTQATVVRNLQRSDILDALLPRWINARAQLREGTLPIWDPLPKGGEAGIQNLSSSELTPAFLLFAMASTPALGFYLATLFNLVAAGFGAHLWMARRLAPPAALFGGITVMACGFHAAWLFWPHTMTSIWICWGLWATDRWWTRPGALNFGLLVMTLVLMVLGSFPFVTLLGLGAIALYALALLSLEQQAGGLVRRLSGLAAALLITLCLCAIPLLSFVEWLRSVDLGYRNASAGSALRLWHDLGLLFPGRAKAAPRVETTMYVGLLPVLLAPLAVPLLLANRRQALMGWFALTLTAAGAVLVFELVPARYLRWVPGLSNNPWSRAIVLLDFGLAFMAAWGLDRLLRFKGSGRILLVLALLATAYQFYDLGTMFRRFNGPVPAGYFYPATPLITQAQEHIRPFQSVIDDDNFLVSGTLGAYGMRQWLAHAFTDVRLRPVLASLADAPFTTPNATRIKASSYHLDSPAMRVLAVRYALGGPQFAFRALTPEMAGKEAQHPLPPMPSHAWVQTLTLSAPACIEQVGVKLATYARTGLPGRVRMALKGSDDSLLATAVVEAAQIADNAVQPFQLSHAACLTAGKYSLAFAYEGSVPGVNLTAWSSPGPGKNCSLSVDGHPYSGCMDVELLAEKHTDSPFKLIASRGGIVLLENMQTPAGPYFLRRLSDVPSAESSKDVAVSIQAASRFNLSYSGAEPGYVVVPMRWTDDWNILVDGRPVRPSIYFGALPAVTVSGPAQIIFRYQPHSMEFGPWIMLLGTGTLILMLLLLHRRNVRRPVASPGH